MSNGVSSGCGAKVEKNIVSTEHRDCVRCTEMADTLARVHKITRCLRDSKGCTPSGANTPASITTLSPSRRVRMAASAISCNHRNIRWDSIVAKHLVPAQPLPHVCGVCSDCNHTIHASGAIENIKQAGTMGVIVSVLIKHWDAKEDCPVVSDILFFRDTTQPAPLPS